jgi:RNA polymerase sigma factor (sigma-70 family)
MPAESDPVPAWDELSELLGPVHEDVHLFARRIARSNAEGDDVFQEAVLRAAHKLGSLRDRSRFKAWLHSIVVSVHRTRCRRARDATSRLTMTGHETEEDTDGDRIDCDSTATSWRVAVGVPVLSK